MRSEVQIYESGTARDYTKIETLLTSVLKELLPQTDINLNEHLVDLGLDSLVATELMARLSAASGIRLSRVLPFQVDTLQDLVTQIDILRQSSRDRMSHEDFDGELLVRNKVT